MILILFVYRIILKLLKLFTELIDFFVYHNSFRIADKIHTKA